MLNADNVDILLGRFLEYFLKRLVVLLPRGFEFIQDHYHKVYV